MVISDFGKYAHLTFQIFYCHKVQLICTNPRRHQIFIRPYHNFIRIRTDLKHECLIPKRKSKSFSLSDRIVDDSFMPSQDLSIRCYKITFRDFLVTFFFNKRCIIVIGYKTDILTVRFVRNLQSDLFAISRIWSFSYSPTGISVLLS